MKKSFSAKVISAIRNGTFWRKVHDKISDFAETFFFSILFHPPVVRWLCRKVWRKVDGKKIVFLNFHGNGYGCNPKYIARELLSRRQDFTVVWLVKKAVFSQAFPKEIKLVKYSGIAALKELATAKYWCNNQSFNMLLKKGLVKKPGQIYIQTFHGALGIKRIGEDILTPGEALPPWVALIREDAAMLDYLISNSEWEAEVVYKKRFYGQGKICMFGHPRNDVFFLPNREELRAEVRGRLGLEPETRTILYVPTFRDSLRMDCYDIDPAGICEAMSRRFGGSWKMLVRFHPKVRMYERLIKRYGDVRNVTKYPDIQELLLLADAVLSDYSSCMFDYMLSRRPIFVFAPDLKQFNDERGFYFPLESAPMPVAQDHRQLIRNIMDFDLEKYQAQVRDFIAGKGCVEDGSASKRVVDLIEEITEGKQA